LEEKAMSVGGFEKALNKQAKTKREIWDEPDLHRQKPETNVDTLWVRFDVAVAEHNKAVQEEVEKALDEQKRKLQLWYKEEAWHCLPVEVCVHFLELLKP
jgi:hypothetical protein